MRTSLDMRPTPVQQRSTDSDDDAAERYIVAGWERNATCGRT